jgi:tetratricopeptide (TPR) repeat protein
VGGFELPLAKLRQLLEAGAYLLARREADRLLVGDLSAAEQGMVLYLASSAALSLRDLFAAIRLGERAIAKAQEAGDRTAQSGAHLTVGQAYALIGDPGVAEQHLEAFLAIRPAEMARWDGLAHQALARAYLQQRAYPAAIERLERAVELHQAWGQLGDRARAAIDLARCYLAVGAPSLAASHLDWVGHYLSDSPSPELTADLLCCRALQARLEGDIAESARLCQELFVPDRPGVTSHHVGEAAWIMGENALGMAHLEEAHLFAEWAMEHAMRVNSPNLMNRILLLKRRIAEQMQARD